MKKAKIIFLGIASILAMASCAPQTSSTSSPTPSSSDMVANHLVCFYLEKTDTDPWKTLSVKDGSALEITFDNPTKDGYDFVEWRTEADAAYVLTTPVTSDLNLYAAWQEKAVDPEELSVTDTKEDGKTYSLVMGWYGKTATSGIDESTMRHFYENARIWLTANGMDEATLNQVTVRQYGDADTNVAPLGELVNADGDVNLLFGVGNNINTTGAVECTKSDSHSIGEVTGRRVALVTQETENKWASDFFAFLNTPVDDTIYATKMFDSSYVLDPSNIVIPETYTVTFYTEVGGEVYDTVTVYEGETVSAPSTNPSKEGFAFVGWVTEAGAAYDFTTPVTASFSLYGSYEATALSVTDTKVEGATYSLVMGWYGKTETSGIDEAVMLHFYENARAYLVGIGMDEATLKQVTVRQYGNADTAVAALGELVNADGDVNLLFGVGNNINTTGAVECTKSSAHNIGDVGSRRIALVTHETENTWAKSLFDYLNTDDGTGTLNATHFFDTSYTYTATA